MLIRLLRWFFQMMGLAQKPARDTREYTGSGKGATSRRADDFDASVLDLPLDDPAWTAVLDTPPPYHRRDHFLSAAELSFYHVLHGVVKQRATLCTKVNLADVFYVKHADSSVFRSYTNKIDRKHVDFLLCAPDTMQPLMGIELDDKSHQRADRQERDAFVDTVFEAASLPLLHIPVKRTYSVSELEAMLAPHLPATPTPPTPLVTSAPPAPSVAPTKTCPKCGKPMVMRTAKQGANAGKSFWGCTGYPQCRTLLPVEE